MLGFVILRLHNTVGCLYTRYNLLSNRLSNQFDNRFDYRLHRVNGVLHVKPRKWRSESQQGHKNGRSHVGNHIIDCQRSSCSLLCRYDSGEGSWSCHWLVGVYWHIEVYDLPQSTRQTFQPLPHQQWYQSYRRWQSRYTHRSPVNIFVQDGNAKLLKQAQIL